MVPCIDSVEIAPKEAIFLVSALMVYFLWMLVLGELYLKITSLYSLYFIVIYHIIIYNVYVRLSFYLCKHYSFYIKLSIYIYRYYITFILIIYIFILSISYIIHTCIMKMLSPPNEGTPTPPPHFNFWWKNTMKLW